VKIVRPTDTHSPPRTRRRPPVASVASRRTWLGLDIAFNRSPQWKVLPLALRGAWISLIFVCGELGNGGRLKGAANWDGREWRQVAGVSLQAARQLTAAGLLVRQSRGSFDVVGYDREREQEFCAQVAAGVRGAAKRWRTPDPPSITPPIAGANGEGDEDGDKDEENTSPKAPLRGPSTRNLAQTGDRSFSPEFERFWNALPGSLKEGKRQAHTVWLRQRLQDRADLQVKIEHALRWQRRSERWCTVNHSRNLTAASYLRNQRWEDDPPTRLERAPREPSPVSLPSDPRFARERELRKAGMSVEEAQAQVEQEFKAGMLPLPMGGS
jgi:hypothetical protein